MWRTLAHSCMQHVPPPVEHRIAVLEHALYSAISFSIGETSALPTLACLPTRMFGKQAPRSMLTHSPRRFVGID